MRKRSFLLFVLLLIFMIAVSESIDLQHIIVGAILSAFIVWFWRDLTPGLPSLLYPKELLLLIRSGLMLIGYVILANIEVVRLLLSFNHSVSPMFIEMDLGVKTNWGRVLLASCITITPGTITVDFDPDNNMFTVHALTQKMGVSLGYWKIVNEIKSLEALVQRRHAHVVDTDRIHDFDTLSSDKSNNRSHGN